MEFKLTVLGESGLQFFGKMSAANAHEIKNALAIINENAGLLGDLATVAEKGVPLDPSRLKRISDTIMQQVRRADDIAKSTNRFAHSVDRMHSPADLEQSLLLIQTMAMRFATQRHILIEIEHCSSSVTVKAQPFRILQLLWLCLQSAMEAVNSQRIIRVRMQRYEARTTIRFGPLSDSKISRVTVLNHTAEMEALLAHVEGHVEVDQKTNDLVLILMRPFNDG